MTKLDNAVIIMANLQPGHAYYLLKTVHEQFYTKKL